MKPMLHLNVASKVVMDLKKRKKKSLVFASLINNLLVNEFETHRHNIQPQVLFANYSVSCKSTIKELENIHIEVSLTRVICSSESRLDREETVL